MKLRKYYIQNKELLTKKESDHILIVNKKTGEFTKISEISLFIWEKIDNKKSFDEILDEILKNYDVKKEIAKKDLDEFLRKSVKNNIIQTIDR